MSRAYRIRIRESAQHTIRAEDHVATTLELLDVLPRPTMAQLLAKHLQDQGFEPVDGQPGVVRRSDPESGIAVTVNTESGQVEVRAESNEEVELSVERTGYGDDDWGQDGRKKLDDETRAKARQDLDEEAKRRTGVAQKKVTDRLEAALGDIRAELDRVVNRTTAEALKAKAAQLGEIKRVEEDTEAGSVTIVLEV